MCRITNRYVAGSRRLPDSSLDRSTFPSDVVSTHLIHPTGVAALERWGLLDQVHASGCPPLSRYAFDFGPFTIAGSPRPFEGVQVAYAPRRTVLDKLLLEAAGAAGAEIREGFTVEQLLFEDGRIVGVRGHGQHGQSVTERARVVIGADGRFSNVARAVGAPMYLHTPALMVASYTYWSDLPTHAYEVFIRPGRGWGVFPTNDNLTLVVVGWPYRKFAAHHHSLEASYLESFDLAPAFAERVRGARRAARFVSTTVEGYFRRPYGPGWALVGDAGYCKDPITGMGISDAFRDAELCANALNAWFRGVTPFETAMAEYQRTRDDQSLAMFDLTYTFARLEPPPPAMQQVLASALGDQRAMDAFVSVMAGTLPVNAFFTGQETNRVPSPARRPRNAVRPGGPDLVRLEWMRLGGQQHLCHHRWSADRGRTGARQSHPEPERRTCQRFRSGRAAQ